MTSPEFVEDDGLKKTKKQKPEAASSSVIDMIATFPVF